MPRHTHSASPLEASVHASVANSPAIGRLISVRGHTAKITKVLPLGTIECVTLDGRHAFRISGLPLM